MCHVLPALWLACHILSLEVWGHSPVESKSEPCNLPLMWDSAEWRDRGGYGKWAALAKPQTLFHVCLLISLLFVSQDVTPPHASFGYFHAFTPTCFPSPRFLYMTLDNDETVSRCLCSAHWVSAIGWCLSAVWNSLWRKSNTCLDVSCCLWDWWLTYILWAAVVSGRGILLDEMVAEVKDCGKLQWRGKLKDISDCLDVLEEAQCVCRIETSCSSKAWMVWWHIITE